MSAVVQEIDPEFRQRYNEIFDAWHAGDLPFPKALEKMEALRAQAIAEDHFANQGGIELILGIMQGYRANYEASIAHFQRARDWFDKAGNRRRMTSCILNIGETYRLKGNYTQAQKHFHMAYEAARDMGDTMTEITALTNEGQMFYSMGQLAKARDRLEKALQLSDLPIDESQTRLQTKLDNLCEIHHALSTLCRDEGQLDAAWQHAKQAYHLAEGLNSVIRRGYANRAVAEVIAALGGAPEEGFDPNPDPYYKAAIEAFREVKAEGEMARTMYLSAGSLAKAGQKRQAARLYQQAMVIFTKLGMTDDAARAAEAQLKLL